MRRSALIIALIVVLFALILWSMGRIPICKCGIGLWSGASEESTSQHFFDPYTFSHVLHGLIFYGVLSLFFRKKLSVVSRLQIAMLIEVSWEVLENTPLIINRYRAATASLDYYGDSILNSLLDLTATVFGFWVAHRFSLLVSIGLIIAIELLMLWLIRDNLTLNVLMLLFPIDAIKEWQLS